MIRQFACLGLSALVTGCATYTQDPTQRTYNAVLTEPPDDQTRDLIRTYVNDHLGPDYVVDPDQLTRSHKLIATDRGRGHVTGQLIPKIDVTFILDRVEMSDGTICQIRGVHDNVTDETLTLPDTVSCESRPV